MLATLRVTLYGVVIVSVEQPIRPIVRERVDPFVAVEVAPFGPGEPDEPRCVAFLDLRDDARDRRPIGDPGAKRPP